jgi:hypothetical protein
MKASTLSVGMALLLSAPVVLPGSDSERSQRPCFQVTVQNQPDNESRVRQTCEWNFSRTVQAGDRNLAETIQRGRVNDNKVRQYSYGSSGYAPRPWRR